MSSSLQGHFLIAADHLRDPNFYRSVVLLLEHNDEGAMGLGLNRPSAVSVETALSEHMQTGSCETPVFVGGPVETSALFIMHNCLSLGQHDQEIAPGVFLAGSHESFESVVNDGLKPEREVRFRVYCGYAGWGSDQLESEIDRGYWLTLKSDGPLILEEDPYGLWEVCMRRLHRANRMLPHNVRNPEWN